MLTIKNLKVKVEEKEILSGISLELGKGQVLAVMGPNGSGKSSLANTLIGNPSYQVTEGEMIFEGKKLSEMSIVERAHSGIMMGFQYPIALPGVTVRELLLTALRVRGEEVSALMVKKQIEEEANKLHIEESLLSRSLNDGFSGGEKKKFEVLQMKLLKPKLLILDEIDSGLDIDALELMAKSVMEEVKKRGMGVVVITHYQRLLKYLRPNRVLVIKNGFVVDQGGEEIVDKLEKSGYKDYE